MDSQFYPLKSQKVSPNGEMTIFEFNQLSDGRTHAPYGTLLSLSHSNNIHHPEEGYTFFAGYCRPLNYNWETDFKILVSCHPAERKLIKTQAILVHGVMIEVKTE